MSTRVFVQNPGSPPTVKAIILFINVGRGSPIKHDGLLEPWVGRPDRTREYGTKRLVQYHFQSHGAGGKVQTTSWEQIHSRIPMSHFTIIVAAFLARDGMLTKLRARQSASGHDTAVLRTQVAVQWPNLALVFRHAALSRKVPRYADASLGIPTPAGVCKHAWLNYTSIAISIWLVPGCLHAVPRVARRGGVHTNDRTIS